MLLTGVRTMVEGQGVLEYFGANGYRLILFFTCSYYLLIMQ